MTGIVATARVEVDAPVERVWTALTDPGEVKAWMFGTDLATDWLEGSPITWSGDYNRRPYQDKGEVVAVDEPHSFTVTHFSPLTGQPDVPENYHTLTYRLEPHGNSTLLSLSQDNNADADEAEHSRANWEQALSALRAHVEEG
jgi:uncharacterized protein YndB with AHSA1/START domain